MTLVPPHAGRVVAWVITYPIIWNHSAQHQIRMAAEAAGMPRCVSTNCLNLVGVMITMIIEHNHSCLYALTDWRFASTVTACSCFLNPMLRRYGPRATSPPTCMAETWLWTMEAAQPTSRALRGVRHRQNFTKLSQICAPISCCWRAISKMFA